MGQIFIVSVCVSLSAVFPLCGGLERVMVGAGLSMWGGRLGKGARPGVWSVLCGASCVEEEGRDSIRPVREGGESCACLQTCWASDFRSSLTSTRCQRWGREYLFDVERERLNPFIVTVQFPLKGNPWEILHVLKSYSPNERDQRVQATDFSSAKSFLKKFQASTVSAPLHQMNDLHSEY